MVEFRVDDRTGDAVLMEVNGRYWGTISLPIFAGVDFPYYHWQLVHGEEPAVAEKYAAGTNWRWTAGHVWRLNELLIAARRSVPARNELLHTLRDRASLFDSSIRDALFTSSDPMPAIFELFQVLKFLWFDDLRTLRRWVSQDRERRTRAADAQSSALVGRGA